MSPEPALGLGLDADRRSIPTRTSLWGWCHRCDGPLERGTGRCPRCEGEEADDE